MKLLLLVLALTFSVMSSAQNRVVSIDAFDYSYTGGFMFKHDGGKNDDQDETTFKLNLNYAQNLEQYVGLMWKAKAFINRSEVELDDSDTLKSSYGAAGGLLYNFDAENVKNSFMTSVLVGIERASLEQNGNDDKSGFNIFLDLEGGKRWDLGQYAAANISYAPTVAFNWKRYGGDLRDEYFKSGYEFKINFLKFDILF